MSKAKELFGKACHWDGHKLSYKLGYAISSLGPLGHMLGRMFNKYKYLVKKVL